MELDCGEEEVNSRGRDARTSIELAAVGGLTRGKTLQWRGTFESEFVFYQAMVRVLFFTNGIFLPSW